MRYTSTINNVKSKEWGLNIKQAYLFSWIYELPSWAETNTIDGEVYYFSSKTKIIEELSLISDKVDTIYRYLKNLEEFGLIKIKKLGIKDFVLITEKGKTWNSEKNPTLGEISEETRKKIRDNSEKNPTYNNIIDNIYKDNKSICGFQENTPLDSSSKDLSKDQTIDFDLLLKFFNQVTGKKIRKVIPKAKNGFISIIKSGYSKADIKNAIINCYKDEYHINTNHKYLTLEFISRMDKFEKYFDVKHKVEVLPSDWFHRELTDNQKKMLKPSSLENWERNKIARQLEGGKLLPIKIEYEQ